MKIDRIFILTLPQSKARLDKLAAQLNLFGLDYEVFYGVQGKDIKFRYECDNLNNGCTASHAQVIQRALIMGLENCLVLEDDCELCDDFPKRLHELQLPKDWDLCYLGGTHIEKPVKITDDLYRCSNTLTTHAYIIKNTFMQAGIMNTLSLVLSNRVGGFLQPVDCYFVDLQKEKMYNFYVVNPPMAWQRSSYSEIQKKQVSYPWLKEKIQ